MSDPSIASMPLLPESWSGYLMGALIGLCLWIGRGFKSDVKELKDAQGKYMTREEITKLMEASDRRAEQAETRLLTMHSQNTDNFREVRLQLESVNTKLFELAKAKEP